jgi:hypothetical protein
MPVALHPHRPPISLPRPAHGLGPAVRHEWPNSQDNYDISRLFDAAQLKAVCSLRTNCRLLVICAVLH